MSVGGVIAAAAVGATLSLVPGTNGSFETVKELPKEWTLQQYIAGASTATIERGDAADGKQFLQLTASKPNHTRVFLPTEVDPQSTYKFSAKIRVPTGTDVPAVLMLDGKTDTTASVDGDDRWRESDLYIRTGDNTQITPVLSLGRFGQLAQGTADFDDVALEKVDAVPNGALVVDAAAGTTPAAGNADAAGTTPATAVDPNGPSKWLVPLAIVLLALVAGCAWVLKRGDANDPALHPELRREDDAVDTASPGDADGGATPVTGDAG